MSPLIPNIPSHKVEEDLTMAEVQAVNLATRATNNHAHVSQALEIRVDLGPPVKVAVNRPKIAAVQSLLTDVSRIALDVNRPTHRSHDVNYEPIRAPAVMQSGLFLCLLTDACSDWCSDN